MISDMGFEPLDQSSVARETENQSNEIGKVLSSDVGAAETDHNCNTASFLSPLDTKDCANKNMSGFDDDWLINSRSQEQTADIRLDKLKSGSVFPSMKCSSSPEAASYGKDHGNCDFLKSSCNDETISMVSDVDESMIKQSPSSVIADDDASSNGPSSANLFSGCNMDDGGIEIVFYADYINYRGVHYVDSTVTFSRSSVIVKSNTINGNTGTFHILLEIEDIIKIESQWSARYELGFTSVHFVSNSAVGDKTVDNTSGQLSLC
ncbi:probable ubiquitin-like-specific protease 2A [Olea europaea var. sylvestris]|uniref:probable ubiquitin-like-specific protease 2A n=1 Tax=Olea europaea var. sylvestris TaxID=158386 RepID=UPI000C1CE133|nr:probable ubiquitin-like-specific protease 2A [Olea europaea var. sylvestris]